jgi:hypothetical protein
MLVHELAFVAAEIVRCDHLAALTGLAKTFSEVSKLSG